MENLEAKNTELSSIDIGRAALKMALSENRAEEQSLRQQLMEQYGIQTVGVDFGGEFVPSVKKIIERAVVAAQRQGLVPSNHVGEGAAAGAVRAALGQLSSQAIGLSVGGKIGVARYGEHLCVAIYMGIGVLNLNEMAVGLAHRSLPT